MSASRKKAVLRKFSLDWLAGYLPPQGFVEKDEVALLDLAGKVNRIELGDIKWICFVREFNSGEAADPERLIRKSFSARPRTEGLWLRLRLKDGEALEGLAANDATLLDAEGIFLTPPDTRSNTQRIFLPRSSIAALEVVAVIGAGKRKPTSPLQESLFRPDLPA